MKHYATLAAVLLTVVTTPSLRAQSAGAQPGRTMTMGMTALNDYEGRGLGAAAEWPIRQVSQHVSLRLGGMAGYHYNAEPFGPVSLGTRLFPVLGVANVQLQRSADSRFTMHAGVTAGLTYVAVSGYSSALGLPDERGTKSSVGVQLGARYWLSSQLGVSGQMGVGDIPGFFGGVMLRW